MPLSFSDHFGIDPSTFDSTGALDPIFDQDTKLFIDPSFLRRAETPELKESYQRLYTHFENIMRLIVKIKAEGDVFWRNADRLLTFPEVKGLCIGYSGDSVDGSGMGDTLRTQMLTTILQLVHAGVDDPVLFEIVGTLEANIGPDRISDMIATIIVEDLVAYTQKICNQFGVPLKAHRIAKSLKSYELPTNPINSAPIILVPKEILNDLPVAETYSDIGWVAARNDAIRAEFNSIVGSAFGSVTRKVRKEMMRNTCINNPDILREILAAYKAANPELYNFDNDPSGEVIWYRAAKDIARSIGLELKLAEKPTLNDVQETVNTICLHFRKLIEDNQLCTLLYDTSGKPKHESAAQKLFFGIADAYCKANNLDLTPEADSGRGPVDFKMSKGYDGRVLVELKLTKNGKFEQGYDKQLRIYQESENKARGNFVLIDVGGASKKRIEQFITRTTHEASPKPSVILIDAEKKPSASTA